MTHQLWYPKASAEQRFSGGVSQSEVSKLVLHSTEGRSWPGYNGGASAPTFTCFPNFSTQRLMIRQHFPANVSAKALVDKAGGVRTNRDNVAQVEIVGTSGWATKRNRNASYTLPETWYLPTYPDWVWRDLADLIKFYNKEWEVPLRGLTFPEWNKSDRLSDGEYDNYKGVLGHSHVPENDHTDPGAIPITKILGFAKDPNTAPAAKPLPKPTPTEDIIMAVTNANVEDFKVLFLAVLKDKAVQDAITIAANSGKYGVDINNDGDPDTIGNINAQDYKVGVNNQKEIRELKSEVSEMKDALKEIAVLLRPPPVVIDNPSGVRPAIIKE